MLEQDFRGARGSGLGDDFHELWSLRHALELLKPKNNMVALTVEGMLPEDTEGHPSDTWDGVDCTMYFGDETIEKASEIIIDQLKYSGSNPEKNWTISRLIKSTAKTKNNSLIRKLAQAFYAIDEKRSSLLDQKKLTIRLVSNQKISQAVITAIQKSNDQTEKLFKASGLTKTKFKRFCTALDFSLCGKTDIMSLEESAIISISSWTASNALNTKVQLLDKIRACMRPDTTHATITKERVSSWFGYANINSLFPCQNSISKPSQFISRDQCSTIVDSLKSGEKFLLIHGTGGCGKTTILFELEELLPSNSKLIIYDCYGAGTYLDSNSHRHLKKDAFLQIINEIALSCGMPSLFPGKDVDNYARTFHEQISRAAKLISSQDSNALLVVAVDAADNAINASKILNQNNDCFIHDIVKLGSLANNVRIIISSRTSRKHDLDLPSHYKNIELQSFSINETKSILKLNNIEEFDDWVEDFQILSKGNPRVQNYAINFGKGHSNQILNFLRPNGKGLSEIFREQFSIALKKYGDKNSLSKLCTALIELPRPIPISVLSQISNLSKEQIEDICSDLAPALSLLKSKISFADEDFEDFVSRQACKDPSIIRENIATHFTENHQICTYSAEHFAQALINAGRSKELIELIKNENEPVAIPDPAHRQKIQRQRLRFALNICNENEKKSDAILMVLIAAEALKTDSQITQIIEENLDLAAIYSPDELSNIILKNPEKQQYHGPALFYRRAILAQQNLRIEAREIQRQIRSWLVLREQHHEKLEQQERYRQDKEWDIPYLAMVSGLEALLLTEGAHNTIRRALKWKPRSWVLKCFLELIKRLHSRGCDEELKQIYSYKFMRRTPWKFILELYKCLSDVNYIPNNLARDLRTIFERGHISNLKLDTYGDSQDHNLNFEIADLILTGCECVISRTSDTSVIRPILEYFSDKTERYKDQLSKYQTDKLDILLRSWSLLEILNNSPTDASQFLLTPPNKEDNDNARRTEEDQYDNKKQKELTDFVDQVAPYYIARAKCFTDSDNLLENFKVLKNKAETLFVDKYSRNDVLNTMAMKSRCAYALAKLQVVPTIEKEKLLTLSVDIQKNNNSSETLAEIVNNFVFSTTLHAQLVDIVAERAEYVRNLKISADDKISSYLILSRALKDISIDDARSLYSDSIKVAAEIDQNTLDELQVFEGYSDNCLNELDLPQRRKIANNIAQVSTDASIILDGYDYFPWESICRSLATLDPHFALACVARWEDTDTIKRSHTLPSTIFKMLNDRTINSVQALSFLPLLSYVKNELLISILDSANPENKRMIASEIARIELGSSGKPSEKTANKLANYIDSEELSFWPEALINTVKFLDENADGTQLRSRKISEYENEYTQKTQRVLEKFDFTECNSVSVIALKEYWKNFNKICDDHDTHISLDKFLCHLRPSSPNKKLDYLKTLASWEYDYWEYQGILKEIKLCICNWKTSPAVQGWCKSELPNVLGNFFLPAILYIEYNNSILIDIINESNLSDFEARKIILSGIEKFSQDINATQLYHLVRSLGKYVSEDDAATVMSEYSTRLLSRLDLEDQEDWHTSTIPNNINDSLGRFFYSYLSDIELRNRWLASHSLRLSSHLGDFSVIESAINCYDNSTDPAFRDPEAPFYWIAARLWLMLTIDRCAGEAPENIKKHAQFIYSQATSNSLPHILIREYAKSAALKLHSNNPSVFTQREFDNLGQVNSSNLYSSKKTYSENMEDRATSDEKKKERRFRFDQMDTIPYWYHPATKIFENLEYEEFIEKAENWIVDQWNVRDECWIWDKEARKNRLGEGFGTMHRHGSLPDTERYNTYLEWHAMWCVIGELLTTHALFENIEEDDSWGTIQHYLSQNGLTYPQTWLADLSGPKPLENRLWFPPSEDDEEIKSWTENIREEDYLVELGLLKKDDAELIVDARHNTHSNTFSSIINVKSALVSSDNAASLCRALQSMEDCWAYYLPCEEDSGEITIENYHLKGWLGHDDVDLKFDEKDPLRYQISQLERYPGKEVQKFVKLNQSFGPITYWKSDNGEIVFKYISWSETPNETNYHQRYETELRSDGHQLSIQKNTLANYLKFIEMDLIFSVEVERKNFGYEKTSYGSKTKEIRKHKIYLLRQNGSIETSDECIGTWSNNS